MFMLICALGYAGGKDIVNNMGDRGINSSIRAQWRNRVESIDTETKRIPANTQGTTMMSVKLPIF
nr:polymorphic toxin type 15 domain-containing protein [Pseudoduganella sp. SL102]